MAQAKPILVPKDYQEYLNQIKERANLLEQLSAGASGLDERIDVSNRLLIETVRLLGEGLKVQLPAPTPPFPGIVPYNVRRLELDTARTTSDPEEVQVPGDIITFYTDGTLSGLQLALDSPSNDWVPIIEFGNPYRYPAKFQKFYLSWTAQPGRYLRVHIGREAGAEAGSAEAVTHIITTSLETRGIFAHDQVAVGVAAVRLSATSFPLWFGVTVKADDDNAGDVYIGDSGVTVLNGFRLAAAAAVTLEVNNVDIVYAIGSAAGQEVQYVGV